MSEKFNLEEHVTDSIWHQTLKEAEEFAAPHGYTIRVVKKWGKGDWKPYIITRGYKKNRINVALDENDKIHHIQGLG